MYCLDEFGHINLATSDGGTWGQCTLTEMGWFIVTPCLVILKVKENLALEDTKEYFRETIKILESISAKYTVMGTVKETLQLIDKVKGIFHLLTYNLIYFSDSIKGLAFVGKKELIGWQKIKPQELSWGKFSE